MNLKLSSTEDGGVPGSSSGQAVGKTAGWMWKQKKVIHWGRLTAVDAVAGWGIGQI